TTESQTQSCLHTSTCSLCRRLPRDLRARCGSFLPSSPRLSRGFPADSLATRVPREPNREGAGTFFVPAPPRVFAHRGFALEAPENTLLAFAKALAIGVTYIETDVHESSD